MEPSRCPMKHMLKNKSMGCPMKHVNRPGWHNNSTQQLNSISEVEFRCPWKDLQNLQAPNQ